MTIIPPSSALPLCAVCGDEHILAGLKGLYVDLPLRCKLAVNFSVIDPVENTVSDATVCKSCLSGLLFSIAGEIQGSGSAWRSEPLVVPVS